MKSMHSTINHCLYAPADACPVELSDQLTSVPSLKRRDISLVHFEFDGHLFPPAVHLEDTVQFRVEVILQHRGPRMFQVKIGIAADRRRTYDVQLVARRDMLNDARSVSKAHV